MKLILGLLVVTAGVLLVTNMSMGRMVGMMRNWDQEQFNTSG